MLLRFLRGDLQIFILSNRGPENCCYATNLFILANRALNNIATVLNSSQIQNNIPSLELDQSAQMVESNSTVSTSSNRSNKTNTKLPTSSILLPSLHSHNEEPSSTRGVLALSASLSSPNLLNTFRHNTISSSSSSDSGVR